MSLGEARRVTDPCTVPVLVLAGLLAATSGVAGLRVHTVRAGESASAIAKQYYGDFEPADLLLRYNGKAGTVLRVGEQLRVPYCEVHVVRSGDSWSGLADKHLGKASLYPVLAALNELPAERPLRIGERIVIPVIVPHELQPGETLSLLAERVYGDTERSRILRDYNQIEDPRKLSVGQSIGIPLMSLRLDPGAVASSSKPKDSARRASSGPSPYTRQLRTAASVFDRGNYDRARELLESMRDRVASNGTDEEKARLYRLLAFVYVAYDLEGEACAAHRSLAGLAAETELEPDLVSPKIRNTLSGCGVDAGD